MSSIPLFRASFSSQGKSSQLAYCILTTQHVGLQLTVLYYEDKPGSSYTIKLEKNHTMFGSVFCFHFLVSCFMLPVLLAAPWEQYPADDCPPSPQPCGYLGNIFPPFTTSHDPKCGLRITGCDDDGELKQIALTDQQWYKIDTIINPTFDPNDLSIFIHYPDFDTIVPEQPRIDKRYFKIDNNITFFGCLRNTENKISTPPNMFLYRHCQNMFSYYDMYFSSSHPVDYPMPNIPFACLLFQVSQPESFCNCPPFKLLFSILQIKLNVPKDCKPCPHGPCKLKFEGQGLNCDPPSDYGQPPRLSRPLVSSPPMAKAKKLGTVINFLYLLYLFITDCYSTRLTPFFCSFMCWNTSPGWGFCLGCCYSFVVERKKETFRPPKQIKKRLFFFLQKYNVHGKWRCLLWDLCLLLRRAERGNQQF